VSTEFRSELGDSRWIWALQTRRAWSRVDD
jgi:hypothetical protein